MKKEYLNKYGEHDFRYFYKFRGYDKTLENKGCKIVKKELDELLKTKDKNIYEQLVRFAYLDFYNPKEIKERKYLDLRLLGNEYLDFGGKHYYAGTKEYENFEEGVKDLDKMKTKKLYNEFKELYNL